MTSLLRRRRDERRSTAVTTSLYYASDLHGSDVCWRKFLGAGRFYGVDALIMGGDLTGKAIVPITRTDDASFSAKLMQEEQVEAKVVAQAIYYRDPAGGFTPDRRRAACSGGTHD